MWDYHSFACLRTLTLDGNIGNSLTVACGRVYVCTSDRVITVYDADELTLLTRLEGHFAYVFCVASRVSQYAQPTRAVIQNEHPCFPMPAAANRPLRFDSFDKGETCNRFVVVTVGVRKARDLEAADSSPDNPGM
ncbi:hypothetical protein T484DRAFT_1769418 [Baffinella frigidus]|nr:hypothetical protein T484DRAFT_1769418 [Cryptophyta sp. CCMP2293]